MASGLMSPVPAKLPLPPRHLAVALDGSPSSANVFAVATLFARRDSKVSIVHIAIPGREDMPFAMTPGGITATFEAQCVTRFRKDQWSIDISPRPAGETTKSALLARINKLGANMLVVGFTGRKGPKEDPTILGSSADFSLRGARMPCCIVKRKVAPRESHLFVVAVDGSERAHSGLQLTEQLAMPGDRIVIVHVVEGTSEAVADGGAGSARLPTDSAISERYTAYAAASSSDAAGSAESPRPKITCERLARTLAGTVADVLINYAEENEADFLVVGADGLGRYAAGKSDHLGSTSDGVVRKCKTNVVVVQNPGAVF